MEQINETCLRASSERIMEKPVQEQSLKCPRCDSSNTKFCYYNNYSLSQPRHFCKACKRYWTRGGTLRTVPIGGGCRKNKRVKRPAAASTTDAAAPPLLAPSSTPTSPFPHIDISMASNHISPLFYGLSNNPSDINFAFSRLHSRVSNVDTVPTTCTGYDIQPQLNAHQGMGFCSSTINSDDEHGDEYRAGFNPTAAQIQGVTSSSLLSNYSLFGSTDSRTTCPTTASLIASNLQLQKLIRGGFKETRPTNHFQSLLPLADLKMAGNHDPALVMAEIKMEEGNNLDRICNEEWSVPFQNQIEPIGSSTNPSLYWNATSVGAWPDLTNFGSSVTSLI